MKESIYHVHIIATGEDHYFGSMTAIFDVFTPEQLNVDLSRLRAWKFSGAVQYNNKTCVIKYGIVQRTPNRRSNRRQDDVRVVRIN